MINKVFVAGGTGFVGSHVINALFARGLGVKALSKNDSRGFMPDGAEIVPGDILSPDGWKDSVSDCSAFINLVGIIREYPKEGVTFDKIHVEAVKNITYICREAGISRLLHISAAGASPEGVSRYLATKYQAEELIMASGLNYTIFRPSLIFGPEDKSVNTFAKVIRSVGAFPVFGNGGYMFEPVYVGDVAEAVAKSVDSPDCYDRTFCLGGPDTISYRDIIISVASSMEEKVYLPSVPVSAARKITSLMGRFRFYPLTRDQLEMLLEGNVCKSSEIFSILGIKRKSLHKYLEERFSHFRNGR